MKHFKKYIRIYWKLALISVVCVAFEAICDLFQPKLMSRLVDNGVLKGNMEFVVRTGLTMLGVVSLGAVFAIVRNLTSSYVSQNFGRGLRDDLFEKVESLSVDDIDRFEGGSLITRMTNDITQVQNSVNMMLRVFLKAPVMCIGAIVMVSTLNVRTVFIVIPVIICVLSIIIISMKLSYPRYALMQSAIDKLNTAMREFLTGIRLVKAFRRFDAEEKRFDTANDNLAKSSIRAARVIATFGPFMGFFANMGIAGIIFLGSRWVSFGLMEVGSIMAFVIYMQQITQSFHLISNILNQVVRFKASAERIAEVFDAETPVRPTGESVALLSNAPAVELSGVGFSYKGATGSPALNDVTFTMESGSILGVIGSTGSGKSTLSSLLLRFYTPTTGEIKLSGVPMAELPEAQLRSMVAVVPQTAMLFSGTIIENILWGKPDASVEEAYRAAELACADSFIRNSCKDGYDTVIGQSGVNLSGGQKQRISIARALIRKPGVLILDDCTSALDAITEAEVRRNLAEYMKETSCVLITQRIGTIMSCDSILVLDNGRAAGFGTHDTLMNDCVTYQDIYRSQIGTRESGRRVS